MFKNSFFKVRCGGSLPHLFCRCGGLAFFLILAGFVFFVVGNIALAKGCFVSGKEGKCEIDCYSVDPYGESITLDSCGENKSCCIPTSCDDSSQGRTGAKCEDSGKCGSGYIGVNTSKCAPPKICCYYPMDGRGRTIDSGSETGGDNIFTGQAGESQTAGEQAGGSAGQTGGLVPCQGFDCTLCSLFKLIKNIINFLTEIVFALAAGFIVWGAIEIMTAGGSEEKVRNGRGRITTAVFGVAIALGAWLFVGTVLQILTDSPPPLPWNEVKCSSTSSQPKTSTQQGTNEGCTSRGGSCQNTAAECKGDWLSNLCLAPGYKENPNMKCCVP